MPLNQITAGAHRAWSQAWTLSWPLILAGLILISCSTQGKSDRKQSDLMEGSWPIFRGDPALSGVSSETLPEKPRLLWSFLTEDAIVATPVVDNDRIFVGSTDGKMYALSVKTGQQIWTHDTSDEIEAPALVLNGLVYFGTLSGEFYALGADSGQVVWKIRVDNGIYGSANWAVHPETGDTLLFVGSYDNHMYCLSSKTGENVWSYETGSYINGAPATDGARVVFGGCDEILHVVSIVDGSRSGGIEVGSYIPGSAAISGNRAYVGHYGDKLVCADLNSLQIIWEYSDPDGGAFFASPAVNATVVLIGGRDGFLHCINRDTGEAVWKFRARDEVDSSPVISKNKIVFGSTDGRLYIVRLGDGQEIWSYEIGASIIGSPAVAQRQIIVGAEDGRVYVFGESG